MPIYYQSANGRLIPVKFASVAENPYTVNVRVTRTTGPWRAGDVYEVSRIFVFKIVKKSCKSRPFPILQMVNLP